MRRNQARIFLATVCASLLVLLSAWPGIAEPSDISRTSSGGVSIDDIVRSLGISSSPVDYVIIVDTSGSMQDSGLYPQVKTALGLFLQALKPTDHLSLLTFDTTATLRYTDAVGNDPRAPLNQLPLTATGEKTDIGAGIEAGIAELERPHANAVGAIVLMTDGKIQAPVGSAYPTPSARAWSTLQDRARKIATRNQISSYALALALEPSTDAALLKTLFSNTVVVALPSNQIKDYLDRVRVNSMRQKAIQILQPDLGNGVEATVSRPLDSIDLGEGTADVPVTFHSTYSKIPVTITNPSADVTGDLQGTISGLPASITLQPGDSAKYTLHLRIPTAEGAELCGEHSASHTGKITLAGTVSSPWERAITTDLALTLAPRLTNTPIDLTGHGATGWICWSSGDFALLAFLFLIVLILIVLAVRRYRTPLLVGTLELSHGGQSTDFPLGGKVLKLGKGARSVPGQPLSGSVRGLQRRDEPDGSVETGVIIHAKSGRARERQQLFDGDSLDIGDVTITYRR